MTKIRARCSFSGLLSMAKDQVCDVSDETAADLIQAGYAESTAPKQAKRSQQEEAP